MAVRGIKTVQLLAKHQCIAGVYKNINAASLGVN